VTRAHVTDASREGRRARLQHRHAAQVERRAPRTRGQGRRQRAVQV
jgi:hypothetical protein